MEQPFLNYLAVTSGYPFTSLLVLRNAGLAPEAKLEFWAGSPDARVDNGKLYPEHGLPVFLVHWAGKWQHLANIDELPYRSLWEFYRRSDLAPDVL
jgi:hypothetical protein